MKKEVKDDDADEKTREQRKANYAKKKKRRKVKGGGETGITPQCQRPARRSNCFHLLPLPLPSRYDLRFCTYTSGIVSVFLLNRSLFVCFQSMDNNTGGLAIRRCSPFHDSGGARVRNRKFIRHMADQGLVSPRPARGIQSRRV
jgi:hypothetical protein